MSLNSLIKKKTYHLSGEEKWSEFALTPKVFGLAWLGNKNKLTVFLPSTVFFPKRIVCGFGGKCHCQRPHKLHSQSPRIVEEIHTVDTLSRRSTSESKMPASQNRLSIAKMCWQNHWQRAGCFYPQRDAAQASNRGHRLIEVARGPGAFVARHSKRCKLLLVRLHHPSVVPVTWIL